MLPSQLLLQMLTFAFFFFIPFVRLGGPSGKSAAVVVDDLLRLVKDLENKMAARRRADSGPVTPKVLRTSLYEKKKTSHLLPSWKSISLYFAFFLYRHRHQVRHLDEAKHACFFFFVFFLKLRTEKI